MSTGTSTTLCRPQITLQVMGVLSISHNEYWNQYYSMEAADTTAGNGCFQVVLAVSTGTSTTVCRPPIPLQVMGVFKYFLH